MAKPARSLRLRDTNCCIEVRDTSARARHRARDIIDIVGDVRLVDGLSTALPYVRDAAACGTIPLLWII
jgi:hypothetical protein